MVNHTYTTLLPGKQECDRHGNQDLVPVLSPPGWHVFDWTQSMQGFLLSSFFIGCIFMQLPGGKFPSLECIRVKFSNVA